MDTIALPSGTNVASLSTRWSADGDDLGLYLGGSMVALLAGSSEAGGFEYVEIGGVVYAIGALSLVPNAAPNASDQLVEIIGTHQGLVGSAVASDADGDPLTFSLVRIEGAYSDRQWSFSDDGMIFADFQREDGPGSEFTDLTFLVSDGLVSTEMHFAVRWGSSDNPDPELRGPAASLQPHHHDLYEAPVLG